VGWGRGCNALLWPALLLHVTVHSPTCVTSHQPHGQKAGELRFVTWLIVDFMLFHTKVPLARVGGEFGDPTAAPHSPILKYWLGSSVLQG
jgi:hypothetical protein